MKTIEIPYNLDIKPYMLPFMATEARFIFAAIHRRGRKTRMALNRQIKQAIQTKGVYYYVLPTYGASKRIIFDELIGQHVPPEIIDKKNESELAIYYKNGSIQRFIGSEDPDSHRGVNAISWVFDEFSEQDPRIWYEIAQPVIRENGGTATFIFTPKGRNHSYKLMQEAKARVAQGDKDYFVTVLSADQTGVYDPKELEEARRSMPDAMFRQEIMCEFLDSATGFFRRVDENVSKRVNISIEPKHQYVLGVDLAKYNDFTVITPFDLNTFEVLPQQRFNQIDWNLQKSRIETAYLRHNHALTRVDATGLGDPIVEDLETKIEVEGFKFTEQSKMELLSNLAVMLEQDKIKLPNDEGLIEELKSFQYTLKKNADPNKPPKMIVECVGTHDDRAMSLALAVWNSPQEPYGKHVANSVFDYSGAMGYPAKEFDPYNPI